MQLINKKKFKKIIKEAISSVLDEQPNVIYTAQKVDSPKELEKRYPSKLPNKFYHHSTNKFGYQKFDDREGEKMTLPIVGRLITDKVDVLVVKNPNSQNDIPHITLATAEGIKPVTSNTELEKNFSKIEPLNDYVETTFKNFFASPRK